MKNKKPTKLKILPFCIAILMVLLITGGIGAYTSLSWVDTKLDFLDGFFALENNKNIQTTDYIKKTLELRSDRYADASEFIDLKFRDPETNEEYSENPLNGSTYKNGVMDLNGYFNVYLTAEVNESENTNGSLEVIYRFNFFNVDYTKIGLEALEDIKKCSLAVVYVDGTELADSQEETDHKEDLKGEAALNYTLENVTAAGYEAIGLLQHQFPYTLNGTEYSKNSGVFDRNAIVGDKEATAVILQSSFIQYGNSVYGGEDSRIDFDKEIGDSATFAIVLTESDGTSYKVKKVLLEGTMENIIHSADVSNAETKEEALSHFHKGYGDKFYAHPEFLKYSWKNIVLFTGIAFVISSVLAVLFYMIWVDDKQKAAPKAKK